MWPMPPEQPLRDHLEMWHLTFVTLATHLVTLHQGYVEVMDWILSECGVELWPHAVVSFLVEVKYHQVSSPVIRIG